MTVNNMVRIIAGFMVLTSIGLGWEKSPLFMNENWIWLAVFVGANLFQSGITRFCPLDIILKKAGLHS